MKKLMVLLLTAVLTLNLVFILPNASSAASAGLAWGPKYVGNLKVYLTNVHNGWAGPKFPSKYTPHTNFHIDKNVNGKYKEVANYHIVKYQKSGKNCVYIYESNKKKTVMDTCSTSWKTLAQKSADAMKSFVKSALDYTNFMALLAIWATVVLVIVDLIVPGDSIPILPNSVSPTPVADDIDYSEDLFITETQPENDTSGFDPLEEIDPETFTDSGPFGPVIIPDLPITSETPVTGTTGGSLLLEPTQPTLPGIPVPGDPTVEM